MLEAWVQFGNEYASSWPGSSVWPEGVNGAGLELTGLGPLSLPSAPPPPSSPLPLDFTSCV